MPRQMNYYDERNPNIKTAFCMKKKFLSLFSVFALSAVCIGASAEGYKTNYTADDHSTFDGRYPKALTVTGANGENLNVDLGGTNFHSLYMDKTADKITVEPGEELTVKVDYEGVWLNAYVFVDEGNDGEFSNDVDEENHKAKEGSDLKSWSFYSFSTTSDQTGWNSAGTMITGDYRSTFDLPSFTAPTTDGTYRMRVKVDWNNIDPAGKNYVEFGGTMQSQGGVIVDLTLEVKTVVKYPTNWTAEQNSNNDSRYLRSFTVKSTGHDDAQVQVSSGLYGPLFYDKTADTEITVTAGQPLNVVSDFQGEWMNAFFYIDEGNDGEFSYEVDTEGYKAKEGSDLKSFSFYNFDYQGTPADEHGYNSVGTEITGNARSTLFLPEFTAPAKAGKYRARMKIDWCNIDPAGAPIGFQFGDMQKNGGVIVDFMLNVEEPAPAETFTREIKEGNGEWTSSNANKTWHGAWQSTETDPTLTITAEKNAETGAYTNNMAAYDEEGHVKLASYILGTTIKQSCDYTLTAQDGYVITGYSFKATNSTAGTSLMPLTITPEGGEAVEVGDEEQTINVTGLSAQSVVFTVAAEGNTFAQTSDFIVTMEKGATPPAEIPGELFVTKPGQTPYRIPSITRTQDGTLVAVVDYRPGGQDIGFGEVDLKVRTSSDNGATWTPEATVADGLGAAAEDPFYTGFGDPCLVADRESNKILLISCAGNVSFPAGTPENHLRMARFYSEDNGATWSEPEDITDQIYEKLNAAGTLGPIQSMFMGSGKIHQSHFTKKGEYYRLYAVIVAKVANGAHANYVVYSDDFGLTWDVLGNTAGIEAGADEPKADEMPNGNVILSSRIQDGRYFNIFAFTDHTLTEGAWGDVAKSNADNDGVVALSNACNGEILVIPAIRKDNNEETYLALQSVPFGPYRANVGIYYKELSEEDYASPAKFAANWDGRYQVSTLGSAYSTMTMQADDKLAFLYEESTYGADYSIIYKALDIETITNDTYSLGKQQWSGITELKGEQAAKKQGIYDLMGRKVTKATKGVYIVDGKKVVINK